MIKIYCDKCGVEINELEAYEILVKGPQIRSWGDEYMYDRKDYQICKDCMKKIADYIGENKKDCQWK